MFPVQIWTRLKMVQTEQNFEKIPEKSSRISLELRKFEPSEYERLAQIRNSMFPDHELSAQEMRSFDDNLTRLPGQARLPGKIPNLGGQTKPRNRRPNQVLTLHGQSFTGWR